MRCYCELEDSEKNVMSSILVTGGCGYIGSRLIPKLLADGHKVKVVDTQWFGNGYLPTDNENLKIIKGDVRDTLIEGDVVIWLSSVSNNAMYPISPTTHDVNTYIDRDPDCRFIYASSVAVLDPTSDYAKDKLECEAKLKDTGAIIVRSASVVGYSPNMRFDTTINKMTHDAYKTGVITVNGGQQKRTHIHIDDICDFYRACITKGEEGKTYTLWKMSETILFAAEMVAAAFDSVGKKVSIDVKNRTDDRSYSLPWRGDDVFNEWFGEERSRDRGHRPVSNAVAGMIQRFDSGMWKDTTDEQMWRINRGI